MYGTIVDWESGISAALQPTFAAHGKTFDAPRVLEAFAEAEAALEARPYLRYRHILARVLDELGARFGFAPSDAERTGFGASVAAWPLFADSADALAALKKRYKLGILTNCDTDLAGESVAKTGVDFDWLITAQQAGSYKPSENNFQFMLERTGLPRERILHVAQSLFHDHVPAKALGFTTVWVNRRAGKSGSGATPPADAKPDYEVPDLESLVKLTSST